MRALRAHPGLLERRSSCPGEHRMQAVHGDGLAAACRVWESGQVNGFGRRPRLQTKRLDSGFAKQYDFII